VHDKLKLAEVLVDAVTEHDELAQPAALKAGRTSAHTSEVNCESEVPDATVWLIGVVDEEPGTVAQCCGSEQHVIELILTVHVPA
jgi:hypothetical protein